MSDRLKSADLGIALLCNHDGRVLTVIQNDFNDVLPLQEGTVFSQWVDEGSSVKAKTLIETLCKVELVNQWELNVLIEDRIETLVFMGACVGKALFIMGAPHPEHLMKLFDDMSRLCNEEVNQFRKIVKESHLAPDPELSSPGQSHFEELSRLNNELANTHRELVKKNKELERLNEQKNRFLGMAAHDLRNPLDVIKTYSSFLEQELGEVLNPEQQEFVSAIKTSSEFMLGLLNDLLDISKIEAGKLTLDREATAIEPLIRDNVKRNRVIAQKKNIAIEVAIPELLPCVMIDAQKIEQVMNNLISNAVKYSHPDHKVFVEVTADEKELAVSIRDQGQGIAPEEIEKLFKPFTTTQTRSTAGEKSTGLGLMIVKKIVEGHDGRMLVESTLGEGSTFTMRLPVTDATPAESEKTETMGVSKSAGDTCCKDKSNEAPFTGEIAPLEILIVEDNPVNSKMLLRVLKRIGYDADAVENGLEALNAVKCKRYDVILMDVNMPVMGGPEAARKIRKLDLDGSAPHILALTADDSEEVIRECREAGMDGFVSKPVDLRKLEEELGRIPSRMGEPSV